MRVWEWIQRRWVCPRYGHLPGRVDPGDPDRDWGWVCTRCWECLDADDA